MEVVRLGADHRSQLLLLLPASIAAHLAALADYWWGVRQYYPVAWTQQFTITILILLALSLLNYLPVSAKFRTMTLLARVVLVITTAEPFAGHPGGFGLIYVILVFEGFLFSPWLNAIVLGVFFFLFTGVLAYLRPPLWMNVRPALDTGNLIVTWAMLILSGIVGHILASTRNRSIREREKLETIDTSNKYLAETNIKLQELAARSERDAKVSERTHIAREIHDTIVYTLTNLLSMLDLYRIGFKTRAEAVPEEVLEARTIVLDGLSDVRAVLRGLRVKDDEGDHGLGNVQKLAEVFSQATGIGVLLNYGDAPQFPGEMIEVVLYRAVQEGLTNAFRHGQATQIMVSFHRLRDGIELSVSDNGQGAAENTGHGFGLLGIGERVSEQGGTVETSSMPGYGFTLRVWLPLPKEDDADAAVTAGDR